MGSIFKKLAVSFVTETQKQSKERTNEDSNDIYLERRIFTLPEKERIKRNKAAIKNLVAVKKKLGDRVQFYYEPGWGRTVSIGEHPNVEEYSQCLTGGDATGAGSYASIETYILQDMDEKAMKALEDWANSP